MAIAAYGEFYDDQGAKIEGSVKIKGREGMVEMLSFDHNVSIPTDTYNGTLTGTRKHDAIEFQKKFDKATVYFNKAVCRGQTLQKVVIHWYDINDNGSEQEYFRHELENVKLVSVAPVTHNVKDIDKERYPHLESVSLRYEKIKWVHV